MAYLMSSTGGKIKLSTSAVATLDLLHTGKIPLSVKSIKDELPYSTRTVQYALSQLRQHALVEKKENFQDLRESIYYLTTKASLYGYK